MLSFANMFEFFADELARLGGGCLPFAGIAARSFNGLLFRHSTMKQATTLPQCVYLPVRPVAAGAGAVVR
jgi:hypothetical protein